MSLLRKRHINLSKFALFFIRIMESLLLRIRIFLELNRGSRGAWVLRCVASGSCEKLGSAGGSQSFSGWSTGNRNSPNTANAPEELFCFPICCRQLFAHQPPRLRCKPGQPLRTKVAQSCTETNENVQIQSFIRYRILILIHHILYRAYLFMAKSKYILFSPKLRLRLSALLILDQDEDFPEKHRLPFS